MCELPFRFGSFPAVAALQHSNAANIPSWPWSRSEWPGVRGCDCHSAPMSNTHPSSHMLLRGRRSRRGAERSPHWGTGCGVMSPGGLWVWEGEGLIPLWLCFGRLLLGVGRRVIWKMVPRLVFLIGSWNHSFLVSVQGLLIEVLNFSCQYGQWMAGNWEIFSMLRRTLLFITSTFSKIKVMGFKRQSSFEVLNLSLSLKPNFCSVSLFTGWKMISEVSFPCIKHYLWVRCNKGQMDYILFIGCDPFSRLSKGPYIWDCCNPGFYEHYLVLQWIYNLKSVRFLVLKYNNWITSINMW